MDYLPFDVPSNSRVAVGFTSPAVHAPDSLGCGEMEGLASLGEQQKALGLVWGCYGLVEMALLSALLLYVRYLGDSEGLPVDAVGWAWMTVASVFHVFHIHRGDVLVFALALALRAASEAAIDGGLAAIAWWAYAVLAREMSKQRIAERYGICVLFVACGLGIANNPYFWRSGCYDCFAPHGIPFTYFHEGGYAGGEGFVWAGVLGNSNLVLVVALAFGLVWNRLAAQTPD